MQTYTLARTGQAPLRFEGEHLAGRSTQQSTAGQDRNRWYELDLYRTKAGTYVLAVAYLTLWQGEHATNRVILCDTPEAVRQELTGFNPTRDVAGYPPGEAYAEKQRRLERTLTLDWQTAVRDLLGELPPEFAEEIA